MINENWKDILGYEGVYQVSDYGRVKRIGEYSNQVTHWKSDRILKPCKKDNGYLFVTLSLHNKLKQKYIHRLVAEAFIPNVENKNTVNHLDLDRTNNYVSKLEWATYQENNVHAIEKMHERGDKKRNEKDLKAVLQYDLKGSFIKEYPSIREVYRQTGIYSIEKVCKGQRKTAGGFIWKYK